MMFVNIVAPSKPERKTLATGFYAVKVRSRGRKGYAEFLDHRGKAHARTKVEISLDAKAGGHPATANAVSASGSFSPGGKGNIIGCVKFDVKGSKNGVRIKLEGSVCF